MKELATAPLRTIVILLGCTLVVIGMLDKITISGSDLTISNEYFRYALIVVGTVLVVAAIFARRLFDDPRSDPLPTQTPEEPGDPPLPVGLYRWGENPKISFLTLLKQSTRLNILGRTGVNILSRNDADVRAFLGRGGHLRILLLDVTRAGGLEVYTEPPANLEENLRKGVRYAESLAGAYPGKVEIRTTTRPPTYGLVWTQSRQDSHFVEELDGLVQLKLYLDYGVTGAGAPHVLITSKDDWYSIVTEAYENAWHAAKVHAAASRGRNA